MMRENIIPFLNTEQMREVDRAMIEDYHIQLIQMMENAGRNLAHLARTRFLGGDPQGHTVVILAGRGGNGGGGLVCARRLHNWGANIHVFKTHPDENYEGVPAHQLNILRRMGVSVQTADFLHDDQPAILIIDAIIGYSLAGAPWGAAAKLIEWANGRETAVLSLDTPSGLDTTTGTIYQPAIQATATMTLALPKQGLRDNFAHVGELYLADISIPPSLYKSINLQLPVPPIFAQEEIIHVKI